MDFVNWCDILLNKLIGASRETSTARSIGIEEWFFARYLYGEGIASQQDFSETTQYTAMWNAVSQLKKMELVEATPFWKVTRDGRAHAADPASSWWKICQDNLDTEHQQMLRVVNRLSPQSTSDHAWLEEIPHENLVSELGWTNDEQFLWAVAKDLEQWGYIGGFFYIGGMQLSATYRGLVWETRRGFTLESRFIDDLVAEWETTSVDFKRQLSLDTMDQKAEFVKDILSLADTKASGRRWLIVGFHDTTHQYFGPPDVKITQNRIEQILARYIEPSVEVKYETVECRVGCVGKLEVIRDPKKLPYRVKEQMNRERKPPLMPGDLFVRHGSQVEKPSDAELLALQEEGDQARSNTA